MSTQAFEVSRQTSEIRTRALAPAIGAEIIGVDLSEPMSDEVFRSEERRVGKECSS